MRQILMFDVELSVIRFDGFFAVVSVCSFQSVALAASVAILVSEILDLVSAKDFGIWLSIWYCSVSHLVSRKNLVSGAFFNIFINKKFGNEEKSEVLIFVCNFF